MKIRNLLLFSLCCLLILSLFSGCQNQSDTESSELSLTQQSSSTNTAKTSTTATVPADGISIQLSDGNTQCDDSSVDINGDVITITKAGTYTLTGMLTDGQIVVNCSDTGEISLVFNGVDITCLTSAPINIMQADKTTLYLTEGSENILSDSGAYEYADGTDEPNAALFSKDDLTIDGSGKLTVNANYNNGIGCKDDLTILNGSIEVYSVDDGIVGRDLLEITGGTIHVTAQSNGMKSTNEDTDKGNIDISGGTITINSEGDGIHAINCLNISGGTFDITTGNGSVNAETQAVDGDSFFDRDSQTDDTDTISAKGLKADVDVTITAGEITVDSLDDSIHSNSAVYISGGALTLSSGDDGIHADEEIVIDNCELSIPTSYEGIEAYNITINGGSIDVVSSDDGINISDSSTTTTTTTGGGMMMDSDNGGMLTITGGTLRVSANGDGLDSNGSITMTGGEVIVDGPVSGGNGSFDYNGTMSIDGGTLISGGSSGMAQNPSESSAQNIISMTFSSMVSAGSTIQLLDEDGNMICEYTSEKEWQALVISTPDIQKGASYTIVRDGIDVVTFEAGDSSITYVNESGVTTGSSGGMGGGNGFSGGFGGGNETGGGRTRNGGTASGTAESMPEDLPDGEMPQMRDSMPTDESSEASAG